MNLEPFLQLGAVGVLGFSFVLVLRWGLHTATKEMRSVAQAISANTMVLLDLHKTLIIHDAQVRGIDPAISENPSNGHEEALAEYRKVRESLDKTADILRQRLTVAAAT